MAVEKVTCPFCDKPNVNGQHINVCLKNPKNCGEPENPQDVPNPTPDIPDVKTEAKPAKKDIATLSNPFGFARPTSFDKPYIDPTTHGQCVNCQKKGVYTVAEKLPYFRGRFLCPVCGPVEKGGNYTYDLFE